LRRPRQGVGHPRTPYSTITDLKNRGRWSRRPWFPRELVELLPVAFQIVDAKGLLVDFNKRAVELWGRAPRLGSTSNRYSGSCRLFHPDGKRKFPYETPTAMAVRTGQPQHSEAVLERADGTRIAVLGYTVPLFDHRGVVRGALNCFQDVTSVKKTEEALRLAASLLAGMNEGAFSFDRALRVTHWNPAMETLSGVEEEKALGRPLLDCFPPPVRVEAEVLLRSVFDGKRPSVKTQSYRSQGSAEEVFVDIHYAPLMGCEEEVVGGIGIVRDVTETVRLNERIRQTQKMEAMGQLTGGVAHDFNNLLTAIVGSLDLIAQRSQDPRIQRLVDNAVHAAEQGANLTRQLLAFARKQHLSPEPIDLNRLIAHASEMLARTLGGAVQVELMLAPDLWLALVDGNQIELALLNLAINARDAMPRGGKLTIASENLQITEPVADLPPGDYVVISVKDTGIGMSEEVGARAFEPFFTTKELRRGSGLGLSMVLGVARQLGGTARIESQIGEGTKVSILLPRTERTLPHADDAEAEAPPLHRGRGTIIVVDDDPGVRETTAAALRNVGFDVHEANGGKTTLELMSMLGHIDALLTDYAMPGMTGAQLIKEALRLRPGMHAVLMTGHAEVAEVTSVSSMASLVRKPFRAAELAGLMTDLIEHGEER